MHQHVKLRKVEVLMYTELDEDIFVLMKGFKAVIKRLKGFGGMGLELGIVDEVEESMSNSEYFQAGSTCKYA